MGIEPTSRGLKVRRTALVLTLLVLFWPAVSGLELFHGVHFPFLRVPGGASGSRTQVGVAECFTDTLPSRRPPRNGAQNRRCDSVRAELCSWSSSRFLRVLSPEAPKGRSRFPEAAFLCASGARGKVRL